MKISRLVFIVLLMAMILPGLSGQKLAKDNMVLTWNFSPKEGVETAKLENFIQEEYLPAAKKSIDDAFFYFLRSDRGDNKGNYSIIVVFESVEARNAWWPEQGVASDKAKKMMEKIKDLEEEFYTLAKIDSWNDWLILK